MKHTTVTIDISYDYITYDGTNADQVYKFAIDSHIVAPGEISDNFEKRPEGIPHMCYEDLLNWWLSTGQIKEETYRGETYTVNTHGVHNMPLWREGEDFKITFKSSREGYVDNVYFKKGMSIVVANDMFNIFHDDSFLRNLENVARSMIQRKYKL